MRVCMVRYFVAFTLWEFFSTVVVLFFPLSVLAFLFLTPVCYPRIVKVCDLE